ncbi:MAG: phosphotransferase [Nitrospirota bacterium]
MMNEYLGTLPYHDPLYEILLSRVFTDVRDPLIHVNRMSHRRVYRYTEERTRTAIIGKFFELHDAGNDRIRRLKGEYDNLEKLRSYGFDTFPNYVVRPITRDERIGLALTEEFVHGRDLDHYLKKAVYGGEWEGLKEKLSKLSAFLFALHERTKTGAAMELFPVGAYFLKILNRLFEQKVISDHDRGAYLKLMDRWLETELFDGVEKVIVHGDATPTNFIFSRRGDVVAIDLERMRQSDPVFDLGMICGELKHAFMWRVRDPYPAERFIRHFLKSYAGWLRDAKRTFREIALRNPFYMAMTELRIARNEYLAWNYRNRLAHEAMECLRWGLKLK